MSYFDPLPWDHPRFEDGNTDDLYDPEAEAERRYFEQWENINDIRFGSDSEWEPPDPQDDDGREYEEPEEIDEYNTGEFDWHRERWGNE